MLSGVNRVSERVTRNRVSLVSKQFWPSFLLFIHELVEEANLMIHYLVYQVSLDEGRRGLDDPPRPFPSPTPSLKPRTGVGGWGGAFKLRKPYFATSFTTSLLLPQDVAVCRLENSKVSSTMGALVLLIIGYLDKF